MIVGPQRPALLVQAIERLHQHNGQRKHVCGFGVEARILRAAGRGQCKALRGPIRCLTAWPRRGIVGVANTAAVGDPHLQGHE